MTGLGDLPGGEFQSMAWAVSGDGSVVVGWSFSKDGTSEAFRWKEGVMVSLDDDPERDSGTIAVSRDGSVVSGYLGWNWEGGHAVYWDVQNAGQPVFLNEFLDDAGINRRGFYLKDPIVTADGSTFVGFAINDLALQIYRVRIAPAPHPVEIADPNLEAAIRLALGKADGSLTNGDMALLTELSAPRLGIADLTGLEAATNLVTLDLSWNEICNVGPLIGLSSLTRLDIADNRIDLTPGCFSRTLIDEYLPFADYEPQRASGATAAKNNQVNLSTRGWVGTGDAVLIDGFCVEGTAEIELLIRGIGPSLQGIGVTNAFSDPVLEVYRIIPDAHAVLVVKATDAGGIAEAEAAERVGAFAIESSRGDAAIYRHLASGLYSNILSSASSAEGIGMIEVYQVQ